MNQVFANRSEEDEIFPLTVKEIVGLQTPIPNYTREGMRRRVSLEYLGYLRLYPNIESGES